MGSFDFSVVGDFYGVLLKGLGITLILTFVVIAICLVIAIPVALARMSPSRWVRGPVTAYVELIRTTPLLLQLFYIYYVLPSFGIKLDAYVAAIAGLSLNYTAYMSEVYRGAIMAVQRSQWDAAASIGMRPSLAFLRIILPQALRIATPTLGNYFISLFKDTSLVSILTVQELMFSGNIITARNYQYFTVYTVVFALYFAVGYPSAMFVRYLERRMQRGYRKRRTALPLSATGDAA